MSSSTIYRCNCPRCMRGGRSQPKEVSRSTYHAHAHLRVASYDDFVSRQTHLQPSNPLAGTSDMQQVLGNRARSPSPAPTTSHANKRRRLDLVSEDNRRPLQHTTVTDMGQPGEEQEVHGDEFNGAQGAGENTFPLNDTFVSVLN